MQRRRFYAPPDNINNEVVMLSRDETHHLTRVLRLKPGDEAFVFDGCGREYRCNFLRVEETHARLAVGDELADVVESPLCLTLGQALAKGEKFDFIVQKATELGVSSIVPLITDRADVKLAEARSEKKVERWRRISLEALKQCGRRRLVEIEAPMTVGELLDRRVRDIDAVIACTVIVFSEQGGIVIADAFKGLAAGSNLTALIGPEGGWSDDEISLFAERGVKSVTLGPRVLRTETAAVVAMTLIQHELGDLSAELK
ncbi:MAG: 16S rRNA (uracil(1498)-N(3))-methyltransferase [Acidobacteriota bacterium]